MKQKRILHSEERKVLDWFKQQRAMTDKWFSIVEITKGVDRNPNASSYRICFRLTAFNLLEHKLVKKHKNRACWGNNSIMVWRLKK